MTESHSRAPEDALGRDDEDTLLAAVRAGDTGAYAELYRRHRAEALRVARRLSGAQDPDDIAQEAFLKVLTATLRGGGPREGFTPYLLRVVRNEAIDRARRVREHAVEDIELAAPAAFVASDGVDQLFDSRLVRRAYAGLPEEWRRILWLTEVEGRSPRELAPLLGRSPNAISQLSRRAREGLRLSWLQAHLERPSESPECRSVAEDLGAYEKGRLGVARGDRVEAHLEGCVRCSAALAELRELSGTLRGVLLPMVLGAPGLLDDLAAVMAADGPAAGPGPGPEGAAVPMAGGADAARLVLLGESGRRAALAMRTAIRAHSRAMITLGGSVVLAVGGLVLWVPHREGSGAPTVTAGSSPAAEPDDAGSPATPGASPDSGAAEDPSAPAPADSAQEPSSTATPTESSGPAGATPPQEPSAPDTADTDEDPGSAASSAPLFVPLPGEPVPEDPMELAPTLPPAPQATDGERSDVNDRPEPPRETGAPEPTSQTEPREDLSSSPSDVPSSPEPPAPSTEEAEETLTVEFPPGGDVALPLFLEGSGRPGAEVRVRDETGREVGASTVGPDGTWTLAPAPGAPDVPTSYRVDHVIDGAIEETVEGVERYTYLAPVVLHPQDGASDSGEVAPVEQWTVLAYRLDAEQEYTMLLDGRRWDLPARSPGTGVFHLVQLEPGVHTLEMAYRDTATGELGARRMVTFTVV